MWMQLLFVHSSGSSGGRGKATRGQPSGIEALRMLVCCSYANGKEEGKTTSVRYFVGGKG
jgi:hypothetical protein